jgi:hypothetical protein
MRKVPMEAPAGVVADCFHLLVNWPAYTLQSNRPCLKGGRRPYYRPKDKKTAEELSLTPDAIRRHPVGEIMIGLYAVTRCVGKNNHDPWCRDCLITPPGGWTQTNTLRSAQSAYADTAPARLGSSLETACNGVQRPDGPAKYLAEHGLLARWNWARRLPLE